MAQQWPNGERPSGWPGTDPTKNVRDEYDKQQAAAQKAAAQQAPRAGQQGGTR